MLAVFPNGPNAILLKMTSYVEILKILMNSSLRKGYFASPTKQCQDIVS